MSDPSIRLRGKAAGALAALCIAHVVVTPALALPRYDGQWSVVIVTEKGDCDRSYRYPVRIENGALNNAGSVPVTISGKVGGNGAIIVFVSYGDKQAKGSGRLTANSGSGSWSGGACAGTWSAERRS